MYKIIKIINNAKMIYNPIEGCRKERVWYAIIFSQKNKPLSIEVYFLIFFYFNLVKAVGIEPTSKRLFTIASPRTVTDKVFHSPNGSVTNHYSNYFHFTHY